MSAVYLNHIEHDRRKPTSDEIFENFARELALSPDYLRFLAGVVPQGIRDLPVTDENIGAALEAFSHAIEVNS